MAPSVLLKQHTTTTKVLQSSNNKVSQGGNRISFAMMAKTKKFSKSHHSTPGFVPDSSTPKRKSTTDNNNNLNVDRNRVLDIPSRIYSISSMSVSEKKELEIKLRRELEEIRVVQRKYLSSNNGNGGGVHSSSHIAPNVKRGVSGRFETVRNAPSSIPASSDSSASLMKQCEGILKRLMANRNSWPFNEPVDPTKLKIPDYFLIISQPMDLGTVMKKLKSGAYLSPQDFAEDVRLAFKNATTYNPPGNHFHMLAKMMSKLFETRWKAIEKKLESPDQPEVPMEREETLPMHQAKRRKVSSKTHPPPHVVPSPMSKVEIKKELMTEDRLHVHRMIESLQDDVPEHIQDFLRRHSIAGDQQPSGEVIEIDIDSLNDDVVLQLKKLLDEHMDYLKSAANQKKEDHCAMEMMNESGVSNSSIPPPCKVNDPDEEDVDVDIGGNDPPMITYPPVEIEKDVRNGRFSSGSSSSSSGDSSSSSSDSDSASSSDSESENANDFAPANSNKKHIQLVATPNHEKSEFFNPNDANNKLEQNTQSKATLFAEDAGQQEKENGPSERQVSPEKRIRAALLKNRFADTILKAQEKKFDKVENGDPEKLRREKEEYERQKKRDKARIQAEAKAAEEACRQSEAAMAAKAKRKREAEREAARQALLRIEKTVEINGNSQFLNDLEILRTVAAPGGEHQQQLIPSCINETSLDHSQDCIGGGYMLGGNNPLEQLGLYMKEDEEDEEEDENVIVGTGIGVDPPDNSSNNNNKNSSNAGGEEVGGEVDG